MTDLIPYERMAQIHAQVSQGATKPGDLTAPESAEWDAAEGYYARARAKGRVTHIPSETSGTF